MDEESIIIGKHLSSVYERDVILAWVRFVPMSNEEIEEYKCETNRIDTKRIYAANDTHGMHILRE